MPDIIKVLPPLIANQIAAGEVIERPASIIKELIENSLDAGSDEIIVTIKKAGNNLISIRDNGCGISKNDLPLAICQHATSKLKEINDLDNITSLGFRGEALASICAVARVQILSKQIDADKAYSITVENKDNGYNITEDTHPVGTTITVRDLFYSTPVRKRFLKADKTESLHIIDIFQKLALSNFNCSFTLISDDKIIYKLIKANDQQNNQGIARVQKIFGKAFVDNATYFSSQGQGIKLEGWLGNSSYHRSQTDQQYFFLNNRVIRDKLILHAVKYVYETLIPDGRHPCYVLYLYLDPAQFDINVHPTKHEVRFCDTRWIHQFITQQLSKVLLEINSKLESTAAPEIAFGVAQPGYQKSFLETKPYISPSFTPMSIGASGLMKSSVLLDNTKNYIDNNSYHSPVNIAYSRALGAIVADINNNLIITYQKTNHSYYFVNLDTVYQYLSFQKLKAQWQESQQLDSHRLPINIELDSAIDDPDRLMSLEQFGIRLEGNSIISVPHILRFADAKAVVSRICSFITDAVPVDEVIIQDLFQQLAQLSLGRLAGNLLPNEQEDILDSLANIQYDGALFNGKYLYKQLVPQDLEHLLSA